ncbi:MFS transporter [Metabacillus iocasae]|uniref:YNFM family putative membrane transporter n=1 Tax=Priestia iocasae TaxID=2291674 RepID=A0ABS2QVR6_9BACI|nr:MFS transporter [Metabacillus iocasae]MBM7703032.1 YNFM family putative membrane transporter [Metabacillus iocasae]
MHHVSFRKAAFALFTGSFVSFMILYIPQTLIPVFSSEFKVNPGTASLSLSLTSATLAISLLFAPLVSNKLGRKRLMILSLMMSSFLCILSAVSPTFIFFLIVRTLMGISLAGFPSIAMTYISEEFPPKQVGIVMGLYVSGTTVGGLTGRVLTGVLTDIISWHVTTLVIGLLSIFLSLLFWRYLPKETSHSIQAYSLNIFFTTLLSPFKRKELRALYALSFLLMGSFVTIYNYIGYLLAAPPYFFSQTALGLLFLIYFVGTFSSTYAGTVANSVGPRKVLLICMLLMIGGLFLTTSSSLILIIIALGILTFGFFGSHSIASRLVGDYAVSNKAQASSLYLLFYYLGASIIGTSGGFVLTHNGWISLVLTLVFFIMIAFSVILLFTKERTIVHHQKHSTVKAGR